MRVIHIAGSYRVGIPASERPAMYEANVGATQRVLDAAIAAGVPRIVYISTVNVFGNTHGRIVDETYRRDLARGLPQLLRRDEVPGPCRGRGARSRPGAPIVIVQPGTVYGAERPFRDRGAAQGRLRRDRAVHRLRRAPASRRPTSTTSRPASSRRSIAAGSARRTSWPARTCALRDAMRIAAAAAGRKPPRLSIPTAVLRLGSRLAPHAARAHSASRPTCARS